ncbi:MAG: DHHA1 domain-containing protein, partial [Candidatus Uhrbacteria bacterium]
GIDTIVCDHHDIPETLPDAILIHPKLPDEKYPNKDLAGTAVGFKFAHALIEEARSRGIDLPEGHEKWLLDLVAIATVTDIMKLTGENRVLEKYGLLVLNKTRRPGLKALIEIAGISGKELETWNIGWQIGPRLNAAGRVNHADDAYELLIEEDETRAAVLAEKLNQENQERQKASEALHWEAVAAIGKVEDQPILFAIGKGWAPGIVGLAAGKICAHNYRPTFVISQDGDKFVGSGRSIEEFNITKAMQAASDYLDRFGGHPQACGFSVTGEEKMMKAIEVMSAYAAKELAGVELLPALKIDDELSMDHLNWDLVDDLEKFRPYGTYNEKPVFLTRQLQIVGTEKVGSEGQHLRLTANPEKGGKMVKLIGFRFGDWAEKLGLGDLVDVVYEIGINEWNGNREIQLRIIDLQISNG